MKIESFSAPNQASQGRNNSKLESTSATPTQAGPAVVTHLSDAARDASGDVDASRVAEVREAIADGRLSFNAEKIADKLIDSVRDLLDSSKP